MLKDTNTQDGSHEEEYRLIKKDLYKVLAINILFLLGLLALYYTNRQTHFLENWFSRMFNV